MTCPRCGTKTDSWPCPNCGFPVLRCFRRIAKWRTGYCPADKEINKRIAAEYDNTSFYTGDNR